LLTYKTPQKQEAGNDFSVDVSTPVRGLLILRMGRVIEVPEKLLERHL
jgi:hypothetical protein